MRPWPMILPVLLGACATTEFTSDDRERANALVVRRYLEEVVSTGDVERLADFISPDYVETDDPTGAASGLDGARAHVLSVRAVWPDLVVAVEQQVAEGEWVATRIRARGTLAGEWLGMAPTGKPVEITGVNLDRVVAGRIVEHGGAANMLLPLLASGALQPVGPPEP